MKKLNLPADYSHWSLVGPRTKFFQDYLAQNRPILEQPLSSLPTILLDQAHQIRNEQLEKRLNLWSVGDGDSFVESLDKKNSKEMTLDFDQVWPTDKDFSDLEGALRLLPDNLDGILFWGLLGGRIDHETFNIRLSYKYLTQNTHCQFNFFIGQEQSLLFLAPGKWQVTLYGIFSFLSFEPQVISLEGKCRYPVREFSFDPFSSQTLSNEAKGIVEIHALKPFYLWFKTDDVHLQKKFFNRKNSFK